jgi:trehalose 6-phosphate phosphatase
MKFEWPEPPDALALFLDIDGTLVPIAPDPWSVRPAPILPELLAGAGRRLGGALAVVSGREIGQIEAVTDGSVGHVAGGHGAEFRFGIAAPVQDAEPRPDIGDLEAELRPFAEANPGLLLEPKRAGIAVHYRQAPHLAAQVRAAMAATLAAPWRRELALLQGDHVLEIRSPLHNKGTAVRRLMQEAPFLGRRPIFIGDDISDEEAFAVVQELGGLAVIVGDRRPTRATRELASPDEVLRMLARLA